MIGKIIGAVAGSQLAKHTSKVGGKTGIALGLIAPTILRRISVPTMLAVAAGGYAIKKLTEYKKDRPLKLETAHQFDPTSAAHTNNQDGVK